MPTRKQKLSLVSELSDVLGRQASEDPGTLTPKELGTVNDDRSHNNYELACAALVTLKGVNMIDLVYDDRVISKLCLLSQAVTTKLIRKHLELRLGKPTEKTIDDALMELENEGQLGPDTDSF